MNTLFDQQDMAEGYAHFRPPLHPQIVKRICTKLRIKERFPLALDIGCGTGLSVSALRPLSIRQIGIEPSFPMLKWSPTVAPQADFINGKAESLPITTHSVDLITAAGSLNWVDLSSFFLEAERVLRPHGLLVIYDFGPGREFSKSNQLSNWFPEFEKRYPVPSCREISPDTLQKESYGFRLNNHEYFEISLQLSPEFYLEYILTETNVVFAINNGIRGQEIRSWCQKTLEPVFQKSTQVVIFRGFIAFLYL